MGEISGVSPLHLCNWSSFKMALLYMGWANNKPSNNIKPPFREVNIIVWNLPALPCVKGIGLPNSKCQNNSIWYQPCEWFAFNEIANVIFSLLLMSCLFFHVDHDAYNCFYRYHNIIIHTIIYSDCHYCNCGIQAFFKIILYVIRKLM